MADNVAMAVADPDLEEPMVQRGTVPTTPPDETAGSSARDHAGVLHADDFEAQSAPTATADKVGREDDAEDDDGIVSLRDDDDSDALPTDLQVVPRDAAADATEEAANPVLHQDGALFVLALQPRHAAAPDDQPPTAVDDSSDPNNRTTNRAVDAAPERHPRAIAIGSAAGGASAERVLRPVCKWDGSSLAEVGDPDRVEWHDALGDDECPLWAQQLAPASLPERWLRYNRDRPGLLRDWRYSYLIVRYGRRLPWVALSDADATQATKALHSIRTPATEDGLRRRARSAAELTQLDVWLDDIARLSRGTYFASRDPSSASEDEAVLRVGALACALTRVWATLVGPVVPVWAVAGCAVEWLASLFGSAVTTGSARHRVLDLEVPRRSAKMVLFDTVDSFAVSRLQSEMEGALSACQHVCVTGGALAEEARWLQLVTKAGFWPNDDFKSGGDAADTRPMWSWALPYPPFNARGPQKPAVDEMPVAWVEMPTVWTQAIEAIVAEHGLRGCHTVLGELRVRESNEAPASSGTDSAAGVDSGREGHHHSGSSAAETERLLLLEDEVAMSEDAGLHVMRAGVKLRLRRQGGVVLGLSGSVAGLAKAVPSPSVGVVSSDVSAVLDASAQFDRAPTPADEAAADDPEGFLAAAERAVALRTSTVVTNAAQTKEEESDAAAGQVATSSVDALSVTGDGANVDADSPWHAHVRYEANSKRLLADLPKTLPRARDGVILAEGGSEPSASHLVSGLIVRDLRTSTLPGTQPIDKSLRRIVSRVGGTGDDASAVIIRVLDRQMDALVSCSTATLVQLLSDERPAARGVATYATLEPGQPVDRIMTEYFDRKADDVSSDDDDEAGNGSASHSRKRLPMRTPTPTPAPTTTAESSAGRRSFTYDIMLTPTSPLLDHTLRRLAVRTGGIALVRRLVYILRDGAGVAEGVDGESIAGDEGHLTVVIAPSPAAARPVAASPEELQLVHRAPVASKDREANRQAMLMAHIRSSTPTEGVTNALSSVPLGGWRKAGPQPSSGGVGRGGRVRRSVGVEIPPAAFKSTALPARVTPVVQTSFGATSKRTLVARRAASPPGAASSSQDLSAALSEAMGSEPEMVTSTVFNLAPRRSQSPKAYDPPKVPPADRLGQHARHPGATAEWAMLDALRKAAASTDPAEAEAAHRRLALMKRQKRLPSAPAGHVLSVDALSGALQPPARALTADPDVEAVSRDRPAGSSRASSGSSLAGQPLPFGVRRAS